MRDRPAARLSSDPRTVPPKPAHGPAETRARSRRPAFPADLVGSSGTVIPRPRVAGGVGRPRCSETPSPTDASAGLAAPVGPHTGETRHDTAAPSGTDRDSGYGRRMIYLLLA